MEKLKIVFLGTPEFAVGILEEISKLYEVVAVVTAPDKPSGRGLKTNISAVKKYALDNNLMVLQPLQLKDETFIETLKALHANVFVVVAFRMLPKIVWQIPKFGTFNLHASLLPNYRGAAPINWAIINGETKTGVTTFFIDDKIDTGEIILYETCDIHSDDNAGVLHDKLITIGKKTVVNTLKLIEENKVITVKQNETEALKTAHKLNKENCKINWDLPENYIVNLVRGLSPQPGAWCFLNQNNIQETIKIYNCHFIEENHNIKFGTIISNKKEIKIATKNGFIYINELQLPNKKKMESSVLLNGYTFEKESYLS